MVESLLRELHDHDVVQVGSDGRIRAAYPFSAVPSAHVVAIDAGPQVFAVCAIDALGIAAMLGRGPGEVAAAADRCCGAMNLFTSTANAHAWIAAHPHITGTILTKQQALRLGAGIFGPLLND